MGASWRVCKHLRGSVWVIALLTWVSASHCLDAQGRTYSVNGALRDSASGQPIRAAVVELRAAAARRSARTDDAGVFGLSNLAPGSYQISVRRIGYAPLRRDVRIIDRDLYLSLIAVPIPKPLDTVRVSFHVPALTGVVGTAAALQPLAGARVQIVGGKEVVTTDSAGRFAASLPRGGAYVLRVEHRGFVDRLLSIDVPPDSVRDVSVLLDSGSAFHRVGDEARWKQFDSRVQVLGVKGALVPSAELRRYGSGTLMGALQLSPSFQRKGLMFGPVVCVFVDGIPMPGLPLDGVPLSEIEAVELYGLNGDDTRSLENAWPRGARCGPAGGLPRRDVVAKYWTVIFAAIWTKPTRRQ